MSAAASIDLAAHDLVVVGSPHGRATGVYARVAGDLAAFGPRGTTVSAATDERFARELAAAWGRPLLDGGVDHGVVVPLRLLGRGGAPVVAVSFAEGLAEAEAVAEAEALVAALRGTAFGGDAALVASVNTAAGLTDRAPLASLDGAAEADQALLRALLGRPRDLLDALPDLARAGSCSTAPLAAFALAFPSKPCDVRAYSHPFGVGYAVAVTS